MRVPTNALIIRSIDVSIDSLVGKYKYLHIFFFKLKLKLIYTRTNKLGYT